MPELPDIEIYLKALRDRIEGTKLISARIISPSLVKTADPSLNSLFGEKATGFRRTGKRIVFEFGDTFMVLHLMISGRLLWKDGEHPMPKPMTKGVHGAFQFECGQLTLTEASTKKRASLHVVRGEAALQTLDPGGIDVFNCTFEEFKEMLVSENRTLKRALTAPQKFSGIGNAYSDEILHHARLSPVRLTGALKDEEMFRLLESCRTLFTVWLDKLTKELVGKFPGRGQVTAFRPDFTVHGKFGQPCPDCGKPVQRISYAEHETNYCAHCQNEGRLLADRSLSRLLKDDWPKTLEELGE